MPSGHPAATGAGFWPIVEGKMTLNEMLSAYGFTHRRVTGWLRVGTHEIFDADGEHVGFFTAGECWAWLSASLAGVA
jgi:hypothetical protein